MKLKALNVSQVNNYIRRILQSDPVLTNISVKGEISNIKYHGNGHVYFALKDNNSKLSCFIAYENTQFIKYSLENGMEVTASGYIYIYEKNGTYSLYVTDIEVSGMGDLHISFEKMKERLEKEGLFSPINKKKLPAFPNKVALVTSETGAAIKDMVTTIQQKNNIVDILIFPCLVQGTFSAKDISSTIQLINERFNDVDTIIIGRGGGSIEELWSFNEEIVARAIYDSKIPIISAVGHETDFTISDFVADIRAATPTAAAEIAVPDTNELLKVLKNLNKDLNFSINKKIGEHKNSLERHNMQVISSLIEYKVKNYNMINEQLSKDIFSIMSEKVSSYRNKVQQNYSNLENLNPEHILNRGYAAITDKEGHFIKSVNKVKEGDHINIMLTDGEISTKVDSVEKRKES